LTARDNRANPDPTRTVVSTIFKRARDIKVRVCSSVQRTCFSARCAQPSSDSRHVPSRPRSSAMRAAASTDRCSDGLSMQNRPLSFITRRHSFSAASESPRKKMTFVSVTRSKVSMGKAECTRRPLPRQDKREVRRAKCRCQRRPHRTRLARREPAASRGHNRRRGYANLAVVSTTRRSPRGPDPRLSWFGYRENQGTRPSRQDDDLQAAAVIV
jgi:hypothetical protein